MLIKISLHLHKLWLWFSQLIQSYFGKLFRQCSDITETFLKMSNKLVVRVSSHIKHSATRRVLYCDKTLLLVYYTLLRALIKVIISHVRLFMIMSHVKIIAFDLSLFCRNYRFSKTVLYIINRKIHGCLEIPDLFLVLCSTLEINLVFPNTHVLFSIISMFVIGRFTLSSFCDHRHSRNFA
jgi:hypothetical protein